MASTAGDVLIFLGASCNSTVLQQLEYGRTDTRVKCIAVVQARKKKCTQQAGDKSEHIYRFYLVFFSRSSKVRSLLNITPRVQVAFLAVQNTWQANSLDRFIGFKWNI